MTLTTADKDFIERRRERVARLRLHGLTAREIANELAQGDDKIVNPDTGEPFTHVTILNDLKALKTEWRKSANVATDEHVARQFAEMQEIKRLAWSTKDGDLAIKALDKEMKLLGTMKQPDGLVINIQLVTEWALAVEARGENPAQLMEEMLQEMALADSERNQS